MNPKTKVTLIIWWIILFFWWWAIFVMSLLWNNKASTDINNSFKKEPISNTASNKNDNTKNSWKDKIKNKSWEKKIKEIKKTKHKIKILSYNKITSRNAEKIFAFKYKKTSWWSIDFKNYDTLKEYNKDLIYKLATKSTDFDLAIIPSEWFSNISYLSNISYKINTNWFNISSIFDYNFAKYVENNNIKAIPFAIDPIVWYSAEKVRTYQTFKTWKNIITRSEDRISENGKIKKMPILLGYDNLYVSYLKSHKSIIPIFDYIYNYYIHKKSKEWVELLKDFWQKDIVKTFYFKLYIKLLMKYKKYKFCNNYEKMCFILWKDSTIVYDFLSTSRFYRKNALNIYKYFKIKPYNIVKTTLALWKSIDEYPARGYIIIINPNIDQTKIPIFLKTYIKMWKDNELPFFKYLISPFNWAKIWKSNDFLSKYIWRFITAENFWMWLKNKLSTKELNYLEWDININVLF